MATATTARIHKTRTTVVATKVVTETEVVRDWRGLILNLIFGEEVEEMPVERRLPAAESMMLMDEVVGWKYFVRGFRIADGISPIGGPLRTKAKSLYDIARMPRSGGVSS